LVSAFSRGLVLMSLSMPELVEERLTANPFGAAGTEEWSLAATGMAAVAFAFFEPDPAIKWGHERVAMLRKALATLSAPPCHDSWIFGWMDGGGEGGGWWWVEAASGIEPL
jgi:hypothetical protein